MTHNQTIAQLQELRLQGMAQALQRQLEQPASTELGFEQRLALLVQHEIDSRYGTVEKDQGFAPTQAETAAKAPAQRPPVEAGQPEVCPGPHRRLRRTSQPGAGTCPLDGTCPE